ncbi:MAG TPA: hypothetical protein PKO06_12380 [Candidatus Ozemobacteraceae bacterium]|nr:hypothetical protein [Candidatus Ozemobacteraceae bacterium]
MISDTDRKDLFDRLGKEEDAKVRYLQGLVDSAVLKIMNSRLTRNQALQVVLEVRAVAAELFPNDMETFDLIYMGRFKRTIDEHCREDE